MNTRSLITTLALTSVLAACKTDDQQVPDATGGELRRMASCDDLRARLTDVITEQLVQSRYTRWYGMPVEDGLGGVVNDAPSSDSAGGAGGGDDRGPTDYTGTNNQEAGVDELDYVKTDGRYLYVAQDRALQIVKSWPIADTAKVATLDLDGWVTGMFLAGSKAVVFQTIYDYNGGGVIDGGGGVSPGDPGTGGVSDGSTGASTPSSGSGGTTGGGVGGAVPPVADTGLVGTDTGRVPPDGGTTVPDDNASFNGTRVTIVDVSDPAHPVVEHKIDVEGWVADARMVDGQIYAVLNQYVDLPPDVWNLVWSTQADATLPPVPAYDAPQEEFDAAADQARTILHDQVQGIVAGLAPEDVLPVWRSSPEADLAVLYACEDLYAPGVNTPLAMLGVTHLDPTTGTLDATGLLSDGWTVYASESNLYVAQTSYWWWGWNDADASSMIHKFALNPTGDPAYLASGTISGWLYDQFAMSEYDGYLRVVTTDFTNWWVRGDTASAPVDPANNVYVLKDDGAGDLATVGHVGGIGPGEQVMAARMIGEKGYVVTYEQTDPLFTLDLSDPTAPRVVGELVMPGYSAYLHPIDDDHLLAVGMSVGTQGWTNGLAVNLFDVSDIAHPVLADQLTFGNDDGWAWSESLWDHHAFTYGRGVLTVPATLQRYDELHGTYEGFSGTISIRATPGTPLAELGRVDHQDLVGVSECLYDQWYGYVGACGWDYGYWYATVRRSVYVEDNLFTISNYGVKVNELNDPGTELARVVFYPQN